MRERKAKNRVHDISVAKFLGYVMDESTSNAEDEISPTDGVVGRRMVGGDQRRQQEKKAPRSDLPRSDHSSG